MHAYRRRRQASTNYSVNVTCRDVTCVIGAHLAKNDDDVDANRIHKV